MFLFGFIWMFWRYGWPRGKRDYFWPPIIIESEFVDCWWISCWWRRFYVWIRYVCLYFIVNVLLKHISVYILEEELREERDPNLEFEDDIMLLDDKEKQWKYVVVYNYKERGGLIHWCGRYTWKRTSIWYRDDFWWRFRIPKGGRSFGLVWRIILQSKRSIMGKLEYAGLIITYLENRIGGGG